MPVVRISIAAPVADRGRRSTGLRIRVARVIPLFSRLGRPQPNGPQPVSRLRPGESGMIVRIASNAPERLVKLSSLGVMPGVRVTLVQRNPAVVLQIAETSIALDAEVADDILVESSGAESGP
jgi:ferrous iron transport protein A